MATAIGRRNGARIAGALIVLLVLAGVLLREPLMGYARTGAAFGARTACSCRYVAGRSLAECKKDFEPGMQAVFLRDDADDKSVTAYVPPLARERARYQPGYGCLLDRWND